MTIDEINRLERARFVEQVGWVCEHSFWVAERAWASRPFDGIEGLHSALVREIACADDAEKLALMNAHPDLGTRARMGDASSGEQAGAGLDQLTHEEFTELTSLNEMYRNKFGFPFLFAVKGSNKCQILKAMRERMRNSPEAEFQEAIHQTSRIVRFRLETLLDIQNK